MKKPHRVILVVDRDKYWSRCDPNLSSFYNRKIDDTSAGAESFERYYRSGFIWHLLAGLSCLLRIRFNESSSRLFKKR
jgi:hypothetical protein